MNHANALDITRPHSLIAVTATGHLADACPLTQDPMQVDDASHLVYRYNDTGVSVVVLNVWDNQPYPHRIYALTKEAQQLRQAGSVATAELREAAAGDPDYPVAVVR